MARQAWNRGEKLDRGNPFLLAFYLKTVFLPKIHNCDSTCGCRGEPFGGILGASRVMVAIQNHPSSPFKSRHLAAACTSVYGAGRIPENLDRRILDAERGNGSRGFSRTPEGDSKCHRDGRMTEAAISTRPKHPQVGHGSPSNRFFPPSLFPGADCESPQGGEMGMVSCKGISPRNILPA